MFKHISLLLFVLFCINSSNIAQTKKQNFILSGNVIDEATGQALQGASIYFPEFKKGVIAGANGAYEITLPQGEHIVEVSFIGFSIYTKTIFIKSNQKENRKMVYQNKSSSRRKNASKNQTQISG